MQRSPKGGSVVSGERPGRSAIRKTRGWGGLPDRLTARCRSGSKIRIMSPESADGSRYLLYMLECWVWQARHLKSAKKRWRARASRRRKRSGASSARRKKRMPSRGLMVKIRTSQGFAPAHSRSFPDRPSLSRPDRSHLLDVVEFSSAWISQHPV